MRLINRVVTKRVFALLFAAGVCTLAHAHLMVAQHGTLNFLDDSVYMVLSLPASAFTEADIDSDERLSLEEFSQHRTDLIKAVNEQVSLSSKNGKLPLDGVMISPVTPHDAPKEPAGQIIVMGRFSLADSDSELVFRVGLYGTRVQDQRLEITASRKSENQKQVFELSPKLTTGKLNFN